MTTALATPLAFIPVARTGGEPPPPPEEYTERELDIWGLHDPGEPPALVSLLAVGTVAILGVLGWLGS